MTNHPLVAYSLSNISAKNYRNRLMCVKHQCRFSETQCTYEELRMSICDDLWLGIESKSMVAVMATRRNDCKIDGLHTKPATTLTLSR